MTHLPLTLGEYTTAYGPVTITRIGKRGKWAFGNRYGKWHVETGEHRLQMTLDITGRAEPAPTVRDDPSPKRIWAWGSGKTLVYCAAVEPSNRSTVEYVRADTVAPVQIEHWRQEVGKLHSQVARRDHEIQQAREYRETLELSHNCVTAERDEAVALLRRWSALNFGGTKTTPETRAFLAKIGEKSWIGGEKCK